MKKTASFALFVLLTVPAFAADNFVQRESDRSGTTGTLNMIGNSVGGFFSNLGGVLGHLNPMKSE